MDIRHQGHLFIVVVHALFAISAHKGSVGAARITYHEAIIMVDAYGIIAM